MKKKLIIISFLLILMLGVTLGYISNSIPKKIIRVTEEPQIEVKVNYKNEINELKAKYNNMDVIAYVEIPGVLKEAVAQTNDNDYYLHYDLERNENIIGATFLDYRNNINNLGRNNIIYGHDRKDDSMFGSLSNIYTKSWQNNKNNHIIKISTPKENTMWQIFSIYHLPATNDYIRTNFGSDNDFQNFINLISNRTMFNFGTKATVNDKILTLSTCYGSSGKERTVVHAKLIKREIKNTSTN